MLNSELEVNAMHTYIVIRDCHFDNHVKHWTVDNLLLIVFQPLQCLRCLQQQQHMLLGKVSWMVLANRRVRTVHMEKKVRNNGGRIPCCHGRGRHDYYHVVTVVNVSQYYCSIN